MIRLPFMVLFIAVGLAANAVQAADPARSPAWPMPQWQEARPADVGFRSELLEKARKYALTGGGSGYITRHGLLVMKWGDPRRRYDLKSTSKSIGVTALALAIADGKIALDDPVVKHHPTFAVPPESNRKTGWIDSITIRHLATQTAGFEKPGGYKRLTFAPGTKWAYSDGGPNWLAECVTLAYGQDVQELMFERVFTPLGIEGRDLRWRNNSYRPRELNKVARREFGSGVHANVDAMARIGYLYLREGNWQGKQLIPKSFVERARANDKQVVGLPVADSKRFGKASNHYGLLWWNNADGTLDRVPRDAYWSWGLYDSLIVVIPSLDIVAARAGKGWQRKWDGHYEVLRGFIEPIAAAASKPAGNGESPGGDSKQTSSRKATRSTRRNKTQAVGSKSKSDSDSVPKRRANRRDAPYPPSRAIAEVRWAPLKTIRRAARGGDNWPITWGDDDRLYTAYGDGHGFRPRVEKKLSMGLATVTGTPENFRGVNLRSKTAERTGGGSSGAKVSGLLMVDGVLYMLVRNTDNSQLAWSGDRGKTWTWADWRFQTSFGYPTFLNYGRNYSGATDEFVYVYSHDSNSAYKRADRMVLARVPQSRIKDRRAYRFFVRSTADGTAQWSDDIDDRGPVFVHPGGCYRSSVSYNGPLRRYLWCQTGAGKDTRFRGGLGIYDAPTPWGPWTTVFYTSQWDTGPGETSCLPTKWMSDDGRTMHLVFSGDDSFSVRKANLVPASPNP